MAKQAGRLTVAEARAALGQGRAVLIDVREDKECREGMVPGATCLPASAFLRREACWRSFLQRLPPDMEIVIYSSSGNRAGQVARSLAAQGWRAFSADGLGAWVRAGVSLRR